jgi:hypothetical protein
VGEAKSQFNLGLEGLQAALEVDGVGEGVDGVEDGGEEVVGGMVLTRPRTGAQGIGRCGSSCAGKGR